MTNSSELLGMVRIGAVTSHHFSSLKLFSHSNVLTNLAFFFVNWVNGIAIFENPSTNECVAPKSISIYAGVLEIDSSLDITEGFLLASVLVSVNTRA